jgi:phosphoadenosine phosphosulfate reductase
MENSKKEILTQLTDQFSRQLPAQNLEALCERFPGGVVFSTSFGLEDQVITDLIASNGIHIEIFTLDTGRLFPETYTTWSNTIEHYGINIQSYYPDATSLQEFVSTKGPNSFYESVENRKSCCNIRKVEPLKRALKGKTVWVTGIRAAQSANRQDMPILEWDESHGLMKYHPLLHWSDLEVKQYINRNNVPYNPLHDKGFVSIGCAPCTRAIKPGEDFRAGRWWWEDNSKKECGLHVHSETAGDLKQ